MISPKHLCAFLGFYLFFSTASFAKFKQFTLEEVGADQYDVGQEEVDAHAEELLKLAEAVKEMKGKSLQKRLAKVIKDDLGEGTIAFFSPDGRVRALDGHHHMKAALKLLRRFDLDPQDLMVTLDVQGDFSAKNPTPKDWKKYAAWREKHYPTYIPDSLRGQPMTEEEIVAWYRGLPDLDHMGDSSMRTATGWVLDQLGLSGSDFKPFFQFRFGDFLESLGFKIPRGKLSKQTKVITLGKILDGGPEGRRTRNFLVNSAVESKRDEVAAKIDRVRRAARHEIAQGAAESDSESGSGGGGGARGNGCPYSFSLLQLDGRHLPTELRLPTTKAQLERLLAGAQSRSLENLDTPRLKNILRRIADNDHLDGKDIDFLLKTRKSSLTLRTAEKVLASEDAKEESKGFRRLVRRLGELNDGLDDWEFKGKVPNSLRDLAKDLRSSLDEDIAHVALDPMEIADFEEAQARNLAWIRKRVAADEMTIGDFHELRRRIRDAENIISLMNDEKPTLEQIGAERFLARLSKRMGRLKDGLVETVDPKKVKRRNELPTRLEKEVKEDLESFLEAAGG